MRGRLEKKLEELQGAAAEVARKERERKYAQRYHKVRALCAQKRLAALPVLLGHLITVAHPALAH